MGTSDVYHRDKDFSLKGLSNLLDSPFIWGDDPVILLRVQAS